MNSRLVSELSRWATVHAQAYTTIGVPNCNHLQPVQQEDGSGGWQQLIRRRLTSSATRLRVASWLAHSEQSKAEIIEKGDWRSDCNTNQRSVLMFEKRITISAGAQIESPLRNSRRWLVAFGWATLVFNIAVILWGAYVRATGSGAGCGNHWPLCNGALTPNASIQTAIELTHRVTSGLLLLSVLCLWVWTRLRMPGKHPSRYAAAIAVCLVVNEAFLGALLVVLEHVAQDKSIARSVWLSLHSVNTMLLVAAIALTAFWTGRPSSDVLRWPATARVLLPALLVIMLLVGATGTVAALGDTLFPAASLSSSFVQDFSSKSHYLLRLRILHPATAVIVTVLIAWFLARTWRSANKSLRRLAIVVGLIFLFQLTLGVLNIVLLAPIWLQMLHLLTADVLWTTLVLLAAKWISSQGASLTRIGRSRRLESPSQRRLLANKPIGSVTVSSVDSHSPCEPEHEIGL